MIFSIIFTELLTVLNVTFWYEREISVSQLSMQNTVLPQRPPGQ